MQRNRFRIGVGFLFFLSFGVLNGQDGEQEIKDLFESQVEAWNRQDLESFMEGYWRSEQLTFFSGNNALRGWQATLHRYRRRYQQADQEMGQLEFRDLRIELLGADHAFVRGRYHLVRTGMPEAEGLFTLILRRFSDGWRIVHDHTSSE